MEMHETLPVPFRGHVRMCKAGKVIFDRDNLVVDLATEVLAQALLGAETIAGVEFGYTKGRPVSRGLRSMPSPVGHAATGQDANTRPFVSRDGNGLRSIITWIAVFQPASAVKYDTLGLVSSSSRLFAAVSVGEVELAAEEPVEVEWTIYLRGSP